MTSSTTHHRSRRQSRLKPAYLLVAAGVVLVTALGAGGYYLLSRKDVEDYRLSARAALQRGDRQAAMIELKNALQLAPQDASLRYELGRLHLANQDYAAAEKELARARELGHAADDLPWLLAKAMLGQQQPKRVLDELTVPEGASAGVAAPLHALRARAQLALGDVTAAEQSLAQATRLDPAHPQVRVSEALLALRREDRPRALALLDQALAADARDPDTWVMKGDLLRQEGRLDEALVAYRRAVQADADHIPARLAVVLVHLQKNELEPAQAELAQLDKRAPDNVIARYFSALLDFRRRQIDSARTKLQQVLKSAPDFLPARLLAGAVELGLGNRQAAIAHLDKVLERLPEHAYARKLKAAALVGSGQVEEAQRLVAGLPPDDLLTTSLQGEIALRKGDLAAARKHLEQAVALAPDNPQLLTQLAQLRQASGDAAGAAQALERAAALDASGRAEALLVQTHLANGRIEEARKAAQALIAEKPKDPLGYLLRAWTELAAKDEKGARLSLGEALKADPGYLPAAATLARLDLQAKDVKAARARFEAVLKHNPQASRARVALAALALQQRDEKTYLAELTQARKDTPKDPLPYELLAAYWLDKRAPAKAMVEARAGLDATGRPQFHDLIGAAQLMQDDRNGALASYQQWAKAAPQDARAHARLAAVHRLRGEHQEALKALDQALALRPEALDLQAARAVVLASVGRADEGLKLARALQQKQPQSPLGYTAEADIHAQSKRPAAAAEAYAKAAQLTGSGQLASLVYRARMQANQTREANDYLRQWLSERPNDALARHTLAEGLLKAGGLAEAAQHYEQLYQANPRDLVAANNLAWIYGEMKDPRAVKQAEAAYALAPEHPSTLDTLGW
ncbi:MAG: PEP-CTERM system TPR-repeat protein PrsT, partial [Thiobacillaceae bacterium]|nr:PEP-CTERM system TPR-repeat protein PrsT [Thiobacillaceae bacterium]